MANYQNHNSVINPITFHICDLVYMDRKAGVKYAIQVHYFP